MLKLILGECRNQIRYYKYIAYTFWEHFYFLSTVHNTVQVPQKIYHTPHPPLDKLPAAVWAVRICEWEHSSASKNAKMSFFPPHSLASFRDIPPFNVLFSLYSKILRIGFSPASHSKPIRLFKWRSLPPPSPGHPGLWRDSAAISWVLSYLHQRG